MRGLFAALLLLLMAAPLAAQNITLPSDVVASARKQAECEVNDEEKDIEPAGALGSGLVLVEVPCWRAAYNFGSILFAVDPKDLSKARLLRFRTLGAKRKLIDTYQLSSPGYDEKQKILNSFHKGRGLGDCGTSGEWRWDGKDFVLTRYWHKEDCDGQSFDGDEARYQVYPFRKKK
ncbi:MAG: DUF1176 domain-containing protein [Xanthobacteraceae bacterium]|nr:DUF1176 domain-containing protein [Xanthobacteraceae bacterium]QYK45298.1 MAG: DUF1176 domain-containing protein [Xanthobacteraceae bacterium]